MSKIVSVKCFSYAYVATMEDGHWVEIGYNRYPVIIPVEGEELEILPRDQIRWKGRAWSPVETQAGFASIAEAQLAFIMRHYGISFRHEMPYEHDLGFAYHPDFYLPQFDAYLELWGYSHMRGEMGDQYRAQMAKKKSWHAEHGTRLLEVHYACRPYRIQLNAQLSRLTGIKSADPGEQLLLYRQQQEREAEEAAEQGCWLK